MYMIYLFTLIITMENIIVASSNLNGIFAIHNYYRRC